MQAPHAGSLMAAASISKGREVIPSSTLLLPVLALFGQFSKQFERDAKDENDTDVSLPARIALLIMAPIRLLLAMIVSAYVNLSI